MIIGWRAWYESEVYDSRTHTWEEIPDDGIQVVYFYKSDGRRLHGSGYSSYFKNPWGFNMDEPREVIKRYPEAIIKRGKWIDLERLEEIEREAADYKWQ